MNLKPKISLIAAVQKHDRGIGKDTNLLWRISADLQRFKGLTLGHPIIMGRKTYESIGRPLPKRTNIVITRNPDFKAEGCIVCSSLEEALTEARKIEQREILIIGGGEIYKQAINFADKLYLTVVDTTVEANIFFPDYSQFTKHVFFEDHSQEEIPYVFIELVK